MSTPQVYKISRRNKLKKYFFYYEAIKGRSF